MFRFIVLVSTIKTSCVSDSGFLTRPFTAVSKSDVFFCFWRNKREESFRNKSEQNEVLTGD